MPSPVLTLLKEITLNLDTPNDLVYVTAKQYDVLARKVKIKLVFNNAPWVIPSGLGGVIRYIKPDQTRGMYDTDDDGNPAIVITAGSSAASPGNIMITLAKQVLTTKGIIKIEVSLYSAAAEKLTTFSFPLVVEEAALSDIPFYESENYFNFRSDMATIRQLNDAFATATQAALEDVSVLIDPSLSIRGAIAEAKAAGDSDAIVQMELDSILSINPHDFTNDELNRFIINNSNTWIYATDGSGNLSRSYFVEIPSGSLILKAENTALTSVTSVIAFLRSLSNMNAGETPDFSISQQGRITFAAPDTKFYKVPSDARYLYVLATATAGTNVRPNIEFRWLNTDATLQNEHMPADAKGVREVLDNETLSINATALTSASDFNTVTGIGIYKATGCDAMQTDILHRPVSTGGILLTIQSEVNNLTGYLCQFYITLNDYYKRYMSVSSGWSNWQKIPNSSETVDYKTELDNTIDVNDIFISGIYTCYSESMPNHLPSPVGGNLIVFKGYTTSQIYMNIYGIYFRQYSTSDMSWSSWYIIGGPDEAYNIKSTTDILGDLRFVQGAISSATGTETTLNYDTRIRTKLIRKNPENKVYLFITDSTKKMYVFRYDLDMNYLGGSGWIHSNSTYSLVPGEQIRIVLANDDDSNIIPGDACSIFANPDDGSDALPILYLNGDITEMSKNNKVTLNYNFLGLSGTCTCKWQGSSSTRYAKKNYTLSFDTSFDAWSKWLTFLRNWKRSHNINSYTESDIKYTWSRSNNKIVRITDSTYTWGLRKKYVAKANWIDPSHARNIVCSRLWGEIVNTRETQIGSLSTSPNGGAVDGFPCQIVINGQSYGLYTFNIPKDEKLFDMGSPAEGDYEYVVIGENNSDGTKMGKICSWLQPIDTPSSEDDSPLYDVDDPHAFAIEYPDVYGDDGTPTSEGYPDFYRIKQSLNNAINAVNVSGESSNWENNCADFLDIDSIIDYYIFSCCIGDHDGMSRNIIYGTYNGTKWFMSAYDMDTTFGSNPYGSRWFDIVNDRNQFAEAAEYDRKHQTYITGDLHKKHRLFYLVHRYSREKLVARYKELRSTVLSDENVWFEFSNFIHNISRNLYNKNFSIWPDILGTEISDMHQYMDFYRMHCKYLDEEIAELEQSIQE